MRRESEIRMTRNKLTTSKDLENMKMVATIVRSEIHEETKLLK